MSDPSVTCFREYGACLTSDHDCCGVQICVEGQCKPSLGEVSYAYESPVVHDGTKAESNAEVVVVTDAVAGMASKDAHPVHRQNLARASTDSADGRTTSSFIC